MLINSFKTISLSKAGLASQMSWGGHFEMETDLRPIFPYINAVVPDARYHNQPEYIQFLFNDIYCTLYAHDILAAPFSGQDTARLYFDKLEDFLNSLYRRKDQIAPNYRKYRPVAVTDVIQLLPQTNCGDCGFPTCMAFAGAMRQGQSTPLQCPGFAKPIYEYAVYPIYDRTGKLLSTVTIEKDPERQKEMPDRSLEIQEISTQSPDFNKTGPSDIALGHPPLTDREKEVLRLLATGATNNDISDTLCISPHTVKSHVIHIFNKLGVNDRTQAAVLAAQKNIL